MAANKKVATASLRTESGVQNGTARSVAQGASSGTQANAADAAATPACCAAHKQTPRSDKLKHDAACRINRTIGQLNGIKSMIEDDRYCGDVLTQLAAVESAVKSVSRMIMQDHLETCVVERIQEGDTEVVDEVMRLFKKFM